MRQSRRFAPYLAGALLVSGLVAGTSTHASSSPAAPSVGSRGVVGHLAYVDKTNRVYTVAVKGSGNTLGATRIGPVSHAPAGKRIAIEGFQASSDGGYVAWVEAVVKKNGDPTPKTPTLVLRSIHPSKVWTVKSDSFPIGFGGDDQLVVSGSHAAVFEPSPSPHLVKIAGAQFPEAVYPGGVVELAQSSSPPGPKVTDRVKLLSFTGKQTTVHNYVMGASNPRLPETAYVSPDGKRLLVERGDHTDFGGIGPSSLVDEFSLDSAHNRTQLGHFGTTKAAWRVGDMSFAWPNDEPWAVFQRAAKGGAKTAVAVYQHGAWRKIVPHGIAVAGTRDGFVATQAGKYVFDSNGIGFTPVPTGDALLLHDTVTKVLGIEASALAWVKTPS